MNPVIKQKWLEALRSDEFDQGTGMLKSYDGKYCCLGVLCELFRRQHSVQKNIDWHGGLFLQRVAVLPTEVIKWAGLEHNNYNPRVGEEQKTLSDYNDTGYSFEQIANLIEENL